MTSKINIKLYGGFREFGNGEAVYFEMNLPATVRDIKLKFAATLEHLSSKKIDVDLLNSSALGNDSEVLSDESIVTDETEFVILPPVCGG